MVNDKNVIKDEEIRTVITLIEDVRKILVRSVFVGTPETQQIMKKLREAEEILIKIN